MPLPCPQDLSSNSTGLDLFLPCFHPGGTRNGAKRPGLPRSISSTRPSPFDATATPFTLPAPDPTLLNLPLLALAPRIPPRPPTCPCPCPSRGRLAPGTPRASRACALMRLLSSAACCCLCRSSCSPSCSNRCCSCCCCSCCSCCCWWAASCRWAATWRARSARQLFELGDKPGVLILQLPPRQRPQVTLQRTYPAPGRASSLSVPAPNILLPATTPAAAPAPFPPSPMPEWLSLSACRWGAAARPRGLSGS